MPTTSDTVKHVIQIAQDGPWSIVGTCATILGLGVSGFALWLTVKVLGITERVENFIKHYIQTPPLLKELDKHLASLEEFVVGNSNYDGADVYMRSTFQQYEATLEALERNVPSGAVESITKLRLVINSFAQPIPQESAIGAWSTGNALKLKIGYLLSEGLPKFERK
jgi:hypothetical protein